ncbi:MAG: spore cortex biosynthesis protein YabQ [Clostridia bacterium]|nr:spore cortex biosynthesis protein YabQ [Clostridia bacterium]
MELSQSDIAALYFTALILGVALGFFFDLLRLPRRLLVSDRSNSAPQTAAPLRKRRAVRIVVFLEDFLFCILASVALILLFYEKNNGKVRPAVFLASIAGFAAYRATLGRLANRLIGTLSRLLRRAIRAALRPLCRIAGKIGNRFRQILADCGERMEKRRRKHYTAAQTLLAETTAAGLLPGDCILKSKAKGPKTKRHPTSGRKEKRRKHHGGTEENAKDHRAEQESMA